MTSRLWRRAMLASCLGLAATALTDAHAQLAIDPSSPTTLDTVRLRYTHVGCTDPNSVRVFQDSNHVSVQVERVFQVDCGTVAGSFEAYTLGRFPAGDYDVTLVVNPPAGTFGPSQLVGTVRLAVAGPPNGKGHPHDDYSAMWWNPAQPGWALTVNQSAERLFLVWATYDDSGRPTWFFVPAGSWSADAANRLSFAGVLYRATGPAFQGDFDPRAVTVTDVGTAAFTPLGPERALFDYTVAGISASKTLQRLRF